MAGFIIGYLSRVVTMKTIKQIKELYEIKTIDRRELYRLAQFIPEGELEDFGLSKDPEYTGKHNHVEMTRDAILSQLKEDVDFGFEKALNHRSISAGAMFGVVMFWNWVLEEGLEDFDENNYAPYGIPLFKATAIKYGLPDRSDEFL